MTYEDTAPCPHFFQKVCVCVCVCYPVFFSCIPVLSMFIERSLMERSALNHHMVFCVLFCNLYYYSYYKYFFFTNQILVVQVNLAT